MAETLPFSEICGIKVGPSYKNGVLVKLLLRREISDQTDKGKSSDRTRRKKHRKGRRDKTDMEAEFNII